MKISFFHQRLHLLSCRREHFYKAMVIRKFALKVSFKSTPMGLHPLEFSCIIVFDLARGTEGMRACRKLVGAGETS